LLFVYSLGPEEPRVTMLIYDVLVASVMRIDYSAWLGVSDRWFPCLSDPSSVETLLPEHPGLDFCGG
jgi:hypothetical protein